jgi:hypothetical protein
MNSEAAGTDAAAEKETPNVERRTSNVEGSETLALQLISRSSSIDFKTPLQWGQWCRSLATAAIDRDNDAFVALTGKQPSAESEVAK